MKANNVSSSPSNWIHNTRDFDATMNNVPLRQVGSRNIGELKTGVEGKLHRV
jgi:autotransporter family porin